MIYPPTWNNINHLNYYADLYNKYKFFIVKLVLWSTMFTDAHHNGKNHYDLLRFKFRPLWFEFGLLLSQLFQIIIWLFIIGFYFGVEFECIFEMPLAIPIEELPIWCKSDCDLMLQSIAWIFLIWLLLFTCWVFNSALRLATVNFFCILGLLSLIEGESNDYCSFYWLSSLYVYSSILMWLLNIWFFYNLYRINGAKDLLTRVSEDAFDLAIRWFRLTYCCPMRTYVE